MMAVAIALIVGTGLGLIVGAACNSWSNADQAEELDDLREMLAMIEEDRDLATAAAEQARADAAFWKRSAQQETV